LSICLYIIDPEKYIEAGKVFEVKRTNTFIIEDCPALWELADSCAKLYNELNFERRQHTYATGVSSIQSISTKNTLH
jgi:hypothetical protein